MSTIRKTVSKTVRSVDPSGRTSTTKTTTVEERPKGLRPPSTAGGGGGSRLPQPPSASSTGRSRIPAAPGATRTTGIPPPSSVRSSLGAGIPKTVKKVTTSSKTSIDESGRKRTVKTTKTTKTVPKPAVPLEPGRYILPRKPPGVPAGAKGTEWPSSPAELRGRLDQKMPISLKGFSSIPKPGTYKDSRLLQKHAGMQDVVSGNIGVGRPADYTPQDIYPPMNYRIDPSTVPEPSPSPPKRTPPTVDLERTVSEDLERSMASASPGQSVRAKGSRRDSASPPVIETPKGPMVGTHQITLRQTVNRSPDSEHITKHMTGIETDRSGVAHKIEFNLQNVEPSMRGDPSSPVEVISTTSSITVGPGIKARMHSTSYETTKQSESGGGGGRGADVSVMSSINPGDVDTMIAAEIKEVERTKDMVPPELLAADPSEYGLTKKVQRLRLTRGSVKQLESSVINPPPTGDEAPEEMQPELMANVMHTEEQGLTMGSPPPNVYDYLFPDTKDDRIVEVSSAAVGPMEKVVVPKTLPPDLHSTVLTVEMQETVDSSFRASKTQPTGDFYAQQVSKTGAAPKVNNTAVKGKRKRKQQQYSLLTAEEPPWAVEGLQPVIDLIGAAPASTLTTADISEMPEDSFVFNEIDNSLEYNIIPAAPRHVSRVQLRGSQKPPWFPGYYSAMPDEIKIARSPSEVLRTAWQAVQPDIFSDDSFMVMG